MHDLDVAVLGAGVVGLACAAALAARGRSVAVLERRRRIGQETPSRDSGVIYAGLYCPAGSLKARLCVEGRAAPSSRSSRRSTVAIVFVARRPKVTISTGGFMNRMA
jgi:L-2-hydroxyglutarate oxidase LhgO